MARSRGFTLIELLVSMAIIATMLAMMAPALKGVRSSVNQTSAIRVAAQLGQSVLLYTADHDDVYPLAMYEAESGNWQTWFGMQTGEAEFDFKNGIMGSYYVGGKLKDPLHRAVPYLGDMSGFGYNYGHIGGDFYDSGDFSTFPNCARAASGTELTSPSSTIVFATSAFHKEEWVEGGDGQTYDFGFIDPPEGWNGNPNMDFRHFGEKTVDPFEEEVHMTGRAIVLFADGSAKGLEKEQVTDEMFKRSQASQ